MALYKSFTYLLTYCKPRETAKITISFDPIVSSERILQIDQ